jgi:hypothetical protein
MMDTKKIVTKLCCNWNNGKKENRSKAFRILLRLVRSVVKLRMTRGFTGVMGF